MKIPPQLRHMYGQDILASAFQVIFSHEGIQVFEEIANDDFAITWSELSREEAYALGILWQMADATKTLLASEPSDLVLLPVVLIKAYGNVLAKLTPYVSLLQRVAAQELTPFEAKVLGGAIELKQGEGKIYELDQLPYLTADAA
jgi:hypothetical protein